MIAIDIKGKVLAHGQGSNAVLVTDKGSTPLTNLRVHTKDGQALVQANGNITDRAGFSVE